MIVKVQRPLNSPNGAWLIYSEDRSIQGLYIPDRVPEGAKRAMGRRYKVYVNVRQEPDGSLVFESRAPEQGW